MTIFLVLLPFGANLLYGLACTVGVYRVLLDMAPWYGNYLVNSHHVEAYQGLDGYSQHYYGSNGYEDGMISSHSR